MELGDPLSRTGQHVDGALAAPQNQAVPVDQPATLDWAALALHLARHGLVLDLSAPPRRFTGGFGNLNYLVHVNGQPLVLRRPPFGVIPKGANDMAREHRVLSVLHRAFPLAPRSIHYCPDPGPIGAHFLLMEYRAGLVLGHQLPSGLNPSEVGPGLSRMLVSVLANLHAVDTNVVGLGGLGRPEGFLHRTAEGWTRRATAVTPANDRSIVDEIGRWLSRTEPTERAATLLHCDFKLDNVILDPASLQARAVLDWDMCTRGDPLFDLGTLLSYWVEANDPPAMHELKQMPTGLPGFFTRAQVMDAYSKATGRDLSDFLFYRVLALFKLGVVFHQLHDRFRRGGTTDPRFAGFGALASGLLEFTHAVMKGRSV